LNFARNAGVERVAAAYAPKFARQPHTITADIDVPEKGGHGVLIAAGGKLGGFSLYLDATGRAVYETTASNNLTGRIASADPVPAGKATVSLQYTPSPRKREREGRTAVFFDAIRQGEAFCEQQARWRG
jgi:arylsulfatase